MKALFKIFFIALLLPTIVFAGPEKFKGKYTKEKTLKKEYTVNASAGLKIENSYGNIDIVTWNENRTSIVVTIKTNGNDENEVEKKLNDISVDFSGNESLVTAKTLFKNSKSTWSWFGSKSNNISMEINYVVKIPVTNSVNINNNYGTISINKLKGRAKIECDYGQLIIGELLADNNSLSFNYTNKSTIEFMKNGTINADYSGFTLGKADQIKLTANYTDSEILDIKSLNYNCDYGKVTINKSQDLIGRGDYLTSRIGTITGSADLNTNYGNITIEKLTSTAKNVSISADYTQVKLGFENNYNFNFLVNTSYSGFKGENTVNVTKSSKDGSDKMYSGYHGSSTTSNSININSSYGNVTFNEL